MIGLHLLHRAVGFGHLHNALGHNLTVALHNVDTEFFEAKGDTFVHLVGHATAAGNNLVERGSHGALKVDAIGSSRLHIVVHLGTLEHRFGGDAAPVEAHTTQLGTLHNSHLHTLLGSLECGNVTTGATTDNYNVVFHIAILGIMFIINYSTTFKMGLSLAMARRNFSE